MEFKALLLRVSTCELYPFGIDFIKTRIVYHENKTHLYRHWDYLDCFVTGSMAQSMDQNKYVLGARDVSFGNR